MITELSVNQGNKTYSLTLGTERIEASIYVNTLPGYGNGYSTEYILTSSPSKKWARSYINATNYTWACRGHGMSDKWTMARGHIRKDKFFEIYEHFKKSTANLEDDDPDLIPLVEEVVGIVENSCNYNSHHEE